MTPNKKPNRSIIKRENIIEREKETGLGEREKIIERETGERETSKE